MERENLLKEYEVTLNSLVEKSKFVYSEEFYKLEEFDKQKYQKDKMATEAHLGTLCNILWGEKATQLSCGLSDIFALSLISSMFNYGGGFRTTPSLPKLDEKDFKEPKSENKAE